MSLTTLFAKSLARLLELLVHRPAVSVTTILYYSDALPRNRRLQRFVRNELLQDENNQLFRFLIGMLKCFC